LNICAKNPPLRQAANRYSTWFKKTHQYTLEQRNSSIRV